MAEQGFGGLAPYHPSWRERIGNAIYDIARMGGLGSIAHRMRKEGGFAADFVPGLGDALALDDAKRDYDAGNYGMAAAGLGLAALGLVPGLGDVAAKGVKKGIRAFHGSPHDFDRFDMSRIGTGEGAQAYGHGLYFAGEEKVAEQYKKDLATTISVDGKPILKNNKRVGTTGDQDVDDFLLAFDGDVNKAVEKAREYAKEENIWGRREPSYYEALAEKIGKLRGSVQVSNAGHMYEVNINADPDDFLDWDKPLREQPPAVQEKLGWTPDRVEEYRRLMATHDDGILAALTDDGQLSVPPEARDAYEKARALVRSIGFSPDQKGADIARGSSVFDSAADVHKSQHLKDRGIPGIKYLDQGSRGTWNIHNPGNGRWEVDNAATGAIKEFDTRDDAVKFLESQRSRNYVVFDDALIEIVRKYGLAGAVAAGLISQEMAQQMQAQGMGEL